MQFHTGIAALNTPNLTAADLKALAVLPETEWFEATGAKTSLFRLQRLVKVGALEQVVINPSITNAMSMYAITKFRRVLGVPVD